jgi:hypothetical protein
VWYIRKRTGRPYHRRVCNLLAAAGEGDFEEGCEGREEMLRKAADRLDADSDTKHLILLELRAAEERFGIEGRFSMQDELDRVIRALDVVPGGGAKGRTE